MQAAVKRKGPGRPKDSKNKSAVVKQKKAPAIKKVKKEKILRGKHKEDSADVETSLCVVVGKEKRPVVVLPVDLGAYIEHKYDILSVCRDALRTVRIFNTWKNMQRELWSCSTNEEILAVVEKYVNLTK